MNRPGSVSPLLDEFNRLGITLWVDTSNRLHARANKGVVTGEIQAKIAAAKQELAGALGSFRCDRCGCELFVDIPIHGGRSRRRDCQRCGHTAGFPVWNPPNT